jgi:hypothetical protein
LVPNHVQKVNPADLSGDYDGEADRIFQKLASSKPDRVPSGFPPKNDTKYRLIRRTASPNGRYALGWAPNENKFRWEDYAEETGAGSLFPDYNSLDQKTSPEVGSLNYLVDLTTHKILGRTCANYEGTRASYNHRQCTVT